jgi:hypothetical protein
MESVSAHCYSDLNEVWQSLAEFRAQISLAQMKLETETEDLCLMMESGQ